MKTLLSILLLTFTIASLSGQAQRAGRAADTSVSATIQAKTPVFAGACKACPWGILAKVTADALSFYGYRTTVCWVCWSNLGPRYMADKTKPVMPPNAQFDLSLIYAEVAKKPVRLPLASPQSPMTFHLRLSLRSICTALG